MYYYIFDPPIGAKEYEKTAHIKELLSSLGIAGEISQPLPGKTVDDLVNNAISKRYSTIVAVGGMQLINAVARSVEPYDIVFGIIPTLPHEDITNLIGTSDWKTAAEQLKRRRWHPVRLGLMNGNTCFLTPAHIEIPMNSAFVLETPEFSVETVGGSIDIIPLKNETTEGSGLRIQLSGGTQPTRGIMGKLFNKKETAPQQSVFTVPEITIHTADPIQVTVAGTPLISTPVRCTTEGKQIRLIVARGGEQ